MTVRFKAAAKVLRIVCAALLLSLGFAHQPVQAVASSEAYSESYRLPDGTFAEICSESGHVKRAGMNGAGHDLPTLRPLCEVCLLATSIILPPPDDEVWLAVSRASLDNPLREFAERLGSTSIARARSRAPPVI